LAADQLIDREILEMPAVGKLDIPANLAEVVSGQSRQARLQEIGYPGPSTRAAGIFPGVACPIAEIEPEHAEQRRVGLVAQQTGTVRSGMRIERRAGHRDRGGEAEVAHPCPGLHPARRIAAAEQWREDEIVAAAA